MDELLKRKFFEAHENEKDITVVMCNYHNQFKERLTAETYIKFTEDEEIEN